MLYRYYKSDLTYKKAYSELFLMLFVLPVLIWCLTSIYYLTRVEKKEISYEQKEIVIKEYLKDHKFSKDELKNYLQDMNVKYPDIVLAQAEIETGHFTSTIFKENNNLFGLKEAKLRPTTAIGTNNNHAYYNNWRESVQDYCLYQASHLKEIKTKEEYLQYLEQNYAEDTNYVNKIKKILSLHEIK